MDTTKEKSSKKKLIKRKQADQPQAQAEQPQAQAEQPQAQAEQTQAEQTQPQAQAEQTQAEQTQAEQPQSQAEQPKQSKQPEETSIEKIEDNEIIGQYLENINIKTLMHKHEIFGKKQLFQFIHLRFPIFNDYLIVLFQVIIFCTL